MADKKYTNVAVKKLPHSECEITAAIPAEVFDTYRTKAVTELGKDVEVPGFRKGKVPADMLINHIGEGRILEKAGNLALQDIYPTIIVDENLHAIGSPQISITKLAAGNPLEFTAKTALLPEAKLPDYAKIAKKEFAKEEKFEVSDDEVQETLNHIRRQRANIESFEQQKKDGVEKPELPEIKDEDLPELTDEFVATLGDFKTVKDFEAKVRENMLEEKKLRGKEKKRIATVEAIIEKTDMDLPELIVNQELARIQAQLEADVAQTGTKLEDYLKSIKKTIEELREEWKPEAEKRAKLQLILNTIAREQQIEPPKDEVEKEIEHVLEHYPDAERENVKIYVETTKRNELVFQHLEKAAV